MSLAWRMPVLLFACAAPLRTANAHAFLLHARPAVGSTTRIAPTELGIDFTSSVEPAFSAITVWNESGAEMDDGRTRADGASGLAVGLRPLPPGRYRVRWRAVSVDTHRTEGSFGFTVAPPG